MQEVLGDVSGAGTSDEPLRRSTWEAMQLRISIKSELPVGK